MDEFFLLRVAVSFIVGGFYIVLIARIAESFSSAIGGALASTPTTMLIGNIFLGLSEGKQALYDSVPGTLLGTACTLLLLLVFIFINRRHSFRIALVTGLLCWLLGIVFLKTVVGSSTLAASMLYLGTVLFTYQAFKKIPVRPPTPKSTHRKVLLFRMILAGSVVASIVVTARLAGGFWGGVTGGFPAMFLSGIYILEKSQGKEFTHSFIKVLPIGSLSIFSYITIVGFLSLKTSLFVTIAAAFITSLVVAFVIYVLRQSLSNQTS